MTKGQSRFSLKFLIAVLAITFLGIQTAVATIINLNGPMPADRDVLDFVLSPDGEYAVYRADQQTNDAFELYRVALHNGTPTRLSGLLPGGAEVEQYAVSEDGRYVVYIAPQNSAEAPELYAVPIDGTASDSKKLNSTIANGEVVAFQISADSTYVVFLATDNDIETTDLYSAPIDGSSPAIKLNAPLPTGGDVTDFQIDNSAGELRVVYRADQHENNLFELFSVPIDGPTGAGLQLNDPLTTDGDVFDFQVSGDGFVIYRANQENSQVTELYTTAVDGTSFGATKLNDALPIGGDVIDFTTSPDGADVVYRADMMVNGRFEIFSVPTAGPATETVKLNGALTPVNGEVLAYAISPDSSRVVYRAIQQTADTVELYSVPLRGPATAGIKLNGTLVANGNVSDFQISPDGQTVVYLADQETVFTDELFGVPITGPTGSDTKLNNPLANNGDVTTFAISADNNWVYYLADQSSDGVQELFRAPLSAAFQAIRINQPLSGERDAVDFAATVDSGRVVYLADQQSDEQFELFIADDNQTEVGFTAGQAYVLESAGQISLPVSLSTSAVLPVAVDYEVVGGTAVYAIDYLAADSRLNYTPGAIEQTITVTIFDNEEFNEDKTVEFALKNPGNATLGTHDTLTLIIRNDDFYTYLPIIMQQ